ncbi:MAG: RluA family pseudouridine synthase [Eubacteriales bacterium]|nr:RluA family pseudouridine synthase [Eubacteriales bacterium]
MEIIYWVTEKDHGVRAVDVLTSRTGMSRLLAKKIRLYGELLKNGKHWRMIDPVETGDQLIARTLNQRLDQNPLRNVPSLPFIYQDEWLAIINKPAGIVVHPTFNHESGTITDLLSDLPLHPVSRLDRDTSGLVLIAKNGHAHHVITSQKMKKQYWALVHGQMPADQGLIDAPIARDPNSIIKRMVSPEGAFAQTTYRVQHYFKYSDISAVKFELLTGRTHQIRVHCQTIGHPLVGDTLYGQPDDTADKYDLILKRQALHAIYLQFMHPISQQLISVHAPLPQDLRGLITLLRTDDVV